MIGKKINQLATELAPVSTDLTIIGDPDSGVSKKITLAQLGAIFSGAVSFYTNLASFPVVGDINVIYCAKDTQKLYLWSGSAYTEVFPSQALLNTYQLRSEKGVSNGYASLDSGGKVPISQLPSSIMEYKGTWSAATNTPTLANGTGDTGDVYICNVAGTVNFGAGPLTFAVGDYVIYSGTIWQRSSGAVGTVTSVAASITGNSVTISGSPLTTSGTLAFAFAGNSTQYINGAGNLVTFPGVINEAQNLITEVYNKTGATLTKGTVVYINSGQGNLPAITKAIATGDSTSAQTYGIVQADITNMNNGYVVVAGRITDLDTQAYTEGTQLYLSSTTAGTYTSTKQYAPNHLVYVAIVVRAHPTQGVIEVKIQNGYEMDELHNVAAQTPSNNDGLFWEASTSLWKNKSIATILGYTPQAQLNGTGFVKASGTTISYDNSTYVTTDTFQTISASKTFSVGFSIASAGGTNQITSFANTNSIHSGSGSTNVLGFNNSNNIYFGKGLNNGGVITFNNAAVRFYALPDTDGTIALVGGSGVGTVTNVSALTIGTTGTDLSSTVANSTTTPVITLNVPTASATNRGALSSADWTTFNSKQNALTNPVTGTGASGQVTFFNGTSTVTGTNNFFWDATNNRLGIGTTTPQRSIEIFNSTADNHLRLSGNAPSVSMGEAVTGSIYQAKFGLVTVNGQFVTAGVAGDFVIISQTGATIIGTSSTEKMRVQSSGNVSINNTNDTFKLDVTGTARLTGQLRLESTITNGTYTYTLPSATGTLALTSALSGYLPLTGGTLTGALGGTSASFSSNGSSFGNASAGSYPLTIQTNVSEQSIKFIGKNDNNNIQFFDSAGTTYQAVVGTIGTNFIIGTGTSGTTRLTIASTGAATFSSTIAATSATFSGNVMIGSGTAGRQLEIYNANDAYMKFNGVRAGNNAFTIGNDVNGFVIFDDTNAAYRLRIANNTGAALFSGSIAATSATFSSSVTATTGLTVGSLGSGSDAVITLSTNASGSPRTIYYKASTATINFTGTGGTDLLTLTNGGNLGIGTTSPSNKLDVLGTAASPNLSGTNAYARFYQSGGYANITIGGLASGSFGGWLQSSDGVGTALPLAINPSGGNVGIGTTSPDRPLDIYSAATVGIARIRANNANGAAITIQNDENSQSISIYAAGSNGFGIGGWAGNSVLESLTGIVYSAYNGNHIFQSGTGGRTERMRITSGGDICINSTSGSNGAIFNITKASGSITTITGGTTSAQNHIVFANPNGNVGSIQVSGSATSYNTSSDYRLKQDFKDFNGLDLLTKIKTYDYEWKSDKTRNYGVIAHELQSVINYAVTGVKDGKDMQQVDYSKIVPVLIKAIQEQQTQIEQLKNK